MTEEITLLQGKVNTIIDKTSQRLDRIEKFSNHRGYINQNENESIGKTLNHIHNMIIDLEEHIYDQYNDLPIYVYMKHTKEIDHDYDTVVTPLYEKFDHVRDRYFKFKVL